MSPPLSALRAAETIGRPLGPSVLPHDVEKIEVLPRAPSRSRKNKE
jgi:hypothetical protein